MIRELNSPDALELRAQLTRCINQMAALEAMIGSTVFVADPGLKQVMADRVAAALDGLIDRMQAFAEASHG